MKNFDFTFCYLSSCSTSKIYWPIFLCVYFLSSIECCSRSVSEGRSRPGSDRFSNILPFSSIMAGTRLHWWFCFPSNWMVSILVSLHFYNPVWSECLFPGSCSILWYNGCGRRVKLAGMLLACDDDFALFFGDHPSHRAQCQNFCGTVCWIYFCLHHCLGILVIPPAADKEWWK